MVRTQIQLTEEQARRLKRRAAQRGVSMATVIRQAVDRVLADDDRESKRQRALSAAGKFRSGRSDIAERHDDYLAEDLWREHNAR
jgi:Arc/MetJ-type ribon-helix-helix transcriptional regulator